MCSLSNFLLDSETAQTLLSSDYILGLTIQYMKDNDSTVSIHVNVRCVYNNIYNFSLSIHIYVSGIKVICGKQIICFYCQIKKYFIEKLLNNLITTLSINLNKLLYLSDIYYIKTIISIYDYKYNNYISTVIFTILKDPYYKNDLYLLHLFTINKTYGYLTNFKSRNYIHLFYEIVPST